MTDTFTFLAKKVLEDIGETKFLNTPHQLGEILGAGFTEVGNVSSYDTLVEELKSLSQLPEKRNSGVTSPSFKTLLGIGIDIEIVLKNITEFLDECSITIGREFPAYPTNHKALAQVAFIEASPRNIATKYNETGEWIKIFPILNVATGLVSVIPMRSLLTMESVKTVGLAKTTRII